MRITHFNGNILNAQYALRVTHLKHKIIRMKTGEKIRKIRLAKNLTLAEVENKADISNGNLSRVERGTQWLSEEKLMDLADALGVNISDFFTQSFEQNVSPAPPDLHPIPVISAIQAGKLKEITDPYPLGEGFAVEYTSDTVSRWTFALEIEGASMLPEFRPGDRVIIDPELSPNPGDYVAAKNTREEATFKKYKLRGIDASGKNVFELVPLNDEYPTLRSDVDHLEIIGVMVEHRKKYRRSNK